MENTVCLVCGYDQGKHLAGCDGTVTCRYCEQDIIPEDICCEYFPGDVDCKDCHGAICERSDREETASDAARFRLTGVAL